MWNDWVVAYGGFLIYVHQTVQPESSEQKPAGDTELADTSHSNL
jgi:hypothetical protein